MQWYSIMGNAAPTQKIMKLSIQHENNPANNDDANKLINKKQREETKNNETKTQKLHTSMTNNNLFEKQMKNDIHLQKSHLKSYLQGNTLLDSCNGMIPSNAQMIEHEKPMFSNGKGHQATALQKQNDTKTSSSKFCSSSSKYTKHGNKSNKQLLGSADSSFEKWHNEVKR